MDDSANSVQKVKSHENLASNFLHQIQWQSLIIISLQDLKQVYSEDFEDHTKMIAIGSLVEERVEQIEYMAVVSIVFLFVGLVIFERFDPIRMICVAGDFL
jgi:hypothetical protein